MRFLALFVALFSSVSWATELRHLNLGEVTVEGMTPLVRGLAAAVKNHEEVVIVDIDSPGGEVYTGLAVARIMIAADKAGTKTLCVVDGMAASMGAYLLQACSYRVMTRRSQILFHEPAVSEVGGKEGDLRRVADTLAELNHMLAIFVCGKLKISVPEFEARIKNRDYWLSPDEAMALGAVDVVIPVPGAS